LHSLKSSGGRKPRGSLGAGKQKGVDSANSMAAEKASNSNLRGVAKQLFAVEKETKRTGKRGARRIEKCK